MRIQDLGRDLVETAFRWFPFPTQTGLRTVGQPGPDSPVLLTCNFDMTVRRVLADLEGLDCYLLVANSKGINVWCAAGGQILNAHSVSSAIKTSGIGDKVTHRRLILPQLAGPGVDVRRVRRETGWECVFGPVYSADIAGYLESGRVKTPEMSAVRFGLKDRLEMAVMWAVPISLVAGLVVALVNWRLLPGLFLLVWGFSLVLYLLYEPIMRRLPGSTGVVKTGLLSLAAIVGILAFGLGVGHWSAARLIGWCAATAAVGLVLGFDLEGTSPLQAGSTVAYWGRKWPAIHRVWSRFGFHMDEWFTLSVDPQICNGCQTCVAVCPKGVFVMEKCATGQRSVVKRFEECEQCTACAKQCPTGAILSEPSIRGFNRPQEGVA